MVWMTLALAGTSPAVGPLFEPAVETGAGTVELSGQTYANDGVAISGARLWGTFQHERWVVGLDARLLDDPFASEHWDVRSANAMLAYLVVEERYLAVMPYVRAGSHLQAGVSLRGRARLPFGALLVDMSFGPAFDLPDRFTATTPDLGAQAVPGQPEAGVALALRGPLRPSVRLGVAGGRAVWSASVGRTLYLEGAVAHAITEQRGLAWLGGGCTF